MKVHLPINASVVAVVISAVSVYFDHWSFASWLLLSVLVLQGANWPED